MTNNAAIIDPSKIKIADQVRFSYRGRDITGTVAKKGSTYAHIVCDDQKEFRVPYRQLVKLPAVANRHVQTANEQLRAAFNPGDRVRFDFRGAVLQGVLVRVNPTRGHVTVNDGKEYRVPYGLLRHCEERALSTTISRNQPELDAIVQLARGLMSQHQLGQWSFQFDNSAKRAGCCHYAAQVISLSYEFARRAPDEEIKDTILHEIAHAVVGQKHAHDAVWRAKAVEIGCSGRRCHDLQFTPPRYIVRCERGCWITMADRRKRGVICKRCRGDVEYVTYTEERWQRAKASP